MKNKLRTYILYGLFAAIGLGCSAGPQKLDEDYMKNAEQWGKTRQEVMQRANGEWDKMSAEDKAKYVETFDGDEAKARAYWDNVKAGPPGQFRGVDTGK